MSAEQGFKDPLGKEQKKHSQSVAGQQAMDFLCGLPRCATRKLNGHRFSTATH
ncbi:MAG TPA: hypothetical protein VI636_02300 [Candidatus Angelobacter sp.]